MRFRRKSAAADAPDTAAEAPAPEETPVSDAAPSVHREGPLDAEDVEDDGVERVDLGSLLVPPVPGSELRIQVDERTEQVQSVVLAGTDGALELRAFAAPRHGDLWSEVRPQLAADMARRGGTATEQEGRFGTELQCQLTVKTADGRTGQQSSRIVGINGSRWMLRATFLGKPAVDADAAGPWEQALSQLAVRRGSGAMPVGDPLPVVLPDQARRLGPQEGPTAAPAPEES
ncbi:DUF3710 domain-containing protein [Nocardioides coralli]|uniref:DUF3710 domain-containing protein n=1 Tax=Nocardioides coralli TaxID=2872154 RepID=UPI001CA3DE63|nr:DUF3710 domain-containing protein [Nocardioides coralli]QZY27841.1 DUF3710 domain-containing protein [Nocardioides coralli]